MTLNFGSKWPAFFERSFIWGRSDTTLCPFLVVNQLADNLVEPIWLDFVMFNLSRKDSSYQDVFMGHRKLKNSQKFDPAALEFGKCVIHPSIRSFTEKKTKTTCEKWSIGPLFTNFRAPIRTSWLHALDSEEIYIHPWYPKEPSMF